MVGTDFIKINKFLMKNNFLKPAIYSIFFVMYFLFLSFDYDETNVKIVKDFNLINVDGNMVSLSEYPDARGFIIVFTCNHCPFAKLYPQRMNELNSKYSALGVPLIAISSTDTAEFEEDTFSKMIKKSQAENFNFPYLFDGEQTIAKNFNAQRTPHAFLIWKEKNEWVIKYNGAIDDNGAEPGKVNNNYVADAVDDLLNGNDVKLNETKSIGCQIQFRN